MVNISNNEVSFEYALFLPSQPIKSFDLLVDEIMATIKEDIRPFDTPTLN